MKKARLMVAVALVSTLLFGCGARSGGGGFAPAENSVYVTRDGEVSGAMVEHYSEDKSNYSEEELKAFAEQAVIEYNREKGAAQTAYNENGEGNRLPAALKSCALKDGLATVVFDFASSGDLIGFTAAGNDPDFAFTGLSVMQMADALGSGSLDGVEFVKPDGKAVSAEDVKKLDKAYVVTVEGSGTIQTEGKVQYMSAGTALSDERTVKIPEQSATSYIIFK